MSDSERFIDGIFDYCDRWCERCTLTARCRLIAIERSLGAWSSMRDALPDRDAECLTFQKQLARLRRQVEALFPGARTFRRPGFDDDALDNFI